MFGVTWVSSCIITRASSHWHHPSFFNRASPPGHRSDDDNDYDNRVPGTAFQQLASTYSWAGEEKTINTNDILYIIYHIY